MITNLILNSDSYKYSQYNQYPPGTDKVFSYIESRGGKYDEMIFFGLQMFIKEYLLNPITKDDIDEAEAIILAHGEPFNRDGWEGILTKHGGYLPLKIRAVPEGTILPVSNVLVTVENTDPEFPWLTSFMETAILRAVWYPCTVATNSYTSKKIIADYLVKSGDISGLSFKLHDFGARGVSSLESAVIGGAAHLVNFMGTDTVSGLIGARKYYGADIAGYSIPAMEHSTVTSWGKENESKSYKNMLEIYGGTGKILACVSDSYDIFNAVENIWGEELRQQVIDSGATVVIRPDSGNPVEVVKRCLYLLESKFGSTTNEKGYRVLNNVRVIQGDGITAETINAILFNAVDLARFSADNIAFGQGGALLQALDRDTMKFAMKCSAARINGEWVDVYKDPITDKGKRSKRGRVDLIKDSTGKFITVREDWNKSELVTVFENGNLVTEWTFDEVQVRASNW